MNWSWFELRAREYRWNEDVIIAVVIALSNCKFWPGKLLSAFMGFQPPMASALALQCPFNWATHNLGVEQFIEFIYLTRDRNETWIEVDLNCGNTDEMTIYCSAKAETMGSIPVDALNFFSGRNLQLLKLPLELRWSHLHFINLFFRLTFCRRGSGDGGGEVNLTVPWEPIIDKQYLQKMSFFYEEMGLSFRYSNFCVFISLKCFFLRFHFFCSQLKWISGVLGKSSNLRWSLQDGRYSAVMT